MFNIKEIAPNLHKYLNLFNFFIIFLIVIIICFLIKMYFLSKDDNKNYNNTVNTLFTIRTIKRLRMKGLFKDVVIIENELTARQSLIDELEDSYKKLNSIVESLILSDENRKKFELNNTIILAILSKSFFFYDIYKIILKCNTFDVHNYNKLHTYLVGHNENVITPFLRSFSSKENEFNYDSFFKDTNI